MQIHSVKLINYKSIGDYPESEIIIEPNVTAIIGKNESGKTNILRGLSEISFTKPDIKAFSDDKVNRNGFDEGPIEYEVILKPTPYEIRMGIRDETRAKISRPNSCTLTGGLVEYYKKECLEEFSSLNQLLGEIGPNPFQIKQADELSRYRLYKEDLGKEAFLDIPLRQQAITFFSKQISASTLDQKGKLNEKLQAAKAKWVQLLRLLPVFYFRGSSARLHARYKLEEVQKELDSPNSAPNSLLSNLVNLIDIPPEKFIEAVRTGTKPTQSSIRHRIRQNIEDKLNKPFRDFYTTEHVSLDIDFNAGVVSFTVKSDEGSLLSLSERSNGLRWYLELFIDLRSNDIEERNVVYLLDEPGISLHVNAQRELLHLFHHLAEKGNQVVYSTHSPYMLDTAEGIHRIRAAVKDGAGYTKVYKTAYDPKISPDSREDTLAPVIKGLGMDLSVTFGPALNKANIILEGMSDYIYLKTMSELLSIDLGNCELIPSVGASNCINIACILHGWGCKYFVVFDYDKGGVESGGQAMKNNLGLEYRKHYCYLKDVQQEEIDAKSYNKVENQCVIEDVFSYGDLDRFCKETETPKNIGKTLKAKLIQDAIRSGTFYPSAGSKENFKRLITRILSYVQ